METVSRVACRHPVHMSRVPAHGGPPGLPRLRAGGEHATDISHTHSRAFGTTLWCLSGVLHVHPTPFRPLRSARSTITGFSHTSTPSSIFSSGPGPCPLRRCASPLLTGSAPARGCAHHSHTPSHLLCMLPSHAWDRCSSCSPFGCGQHALPNETGAQPGDHGSWPLNKCTQLHTTAC